MQEDHNFRVRLSYTLSEILTCKGKYHLLHRKDRPRLALQLECSYTQTLGCSLGYPVGALEYLI